MSLHSPPIRTSSTDVGTLTGKRPKFSITLERSQRAGLALRMILLHLLDALEDNVEGTIRGLDPEFLHDLRVACRRTRSALSRLKGVYSAGVIGPFKPELKWLGTVTGDLRDLDVFLLGLPELRTSALPDAEASFEEVESVIVENRSRAQLEVADALKSDRFSGLVTGWRRVLDSADSMTGPEAERPVDDISRDRIAAAFRKILKRGDRLGDDPPPEALHRLRIDAKRLRYLLEFFKSLYPETDITARIKELKRLQNTLGEFNDYDVQQKMLHNLVFKASDHRTGTGGDALRADALINLLVQRREERRGAFLTAYEEFSCEAVRTAFTDLFGGRVGR